MMLQALPNRTPAGCFHSASILLVLGSLFVPRHLHHRYHAHGSVAEPEGDDLQDCNLTSLNVQPNDQKWLINCLGAIQFSGVQCGQPIPSSIDRMLW
jgi:hypothetical protein